MAAEIKYPIGVQSFEKLRTDGFLYVDKTDLIFKLAKNSNCVFLSRPRRFGKSLLMSTIDSYFQGRHDLFEGLAIEKLENEWTRHPVFHFDLNAGNYREKNGLESLLNFQLSRYEEIYGSSPSATTLENRFAWLLEAAHKQTGNTCVVLVDEYDKPILSSLGGENELDEHYRSVLKPFYGNLKSMDSHIRFTMLTGVSRFSKLSIFSDLNNLDDISMDTEYAAICGMTRNEINVYFQSAVEAIGRKEGLSYQESLDELERNYDGYRFAPEAERVFNPFSLLSCLKKERMGDFWFETGTPTYLVNLLRTREYDLSQLEKERVASSTLLDIENNDPLSVLYQTGYLTIRDYDRRRRLYTLCYPNREVEWGFLNYLLPTYSGLQRSRTAVTIYDMLDCLEEGRTEDFIEEVKAIIAGIPYTTDNSVKMQELQFQNLMYLIFKLLGLEIQVEVRVSTGRIDAVAQTDKYIHIFEFKVDADVEEAMRQIEEKRYADTCRYSGRQIIAVGMVYSTAERGISAVSVNKEI